MYLKLLMCELCAVGLAWAWSSPESFTEKNLKWFLGYGKIRFPPLEYPHPYPPPPAYPWDFDEVNRPFIRTTANHLRAMAITHSAKKLIPMVTAPEYGIPRKQAYLPELGIDVLNPQVEKTSDETIVCYLEVAGKMVEVTYWQTITIRYMDLKENSNTREFTGRCACLIQAFLHM